MKTSVKELAWQWIKASPKIAETTPFQYYCQTRDVFQARLDGMASLLLKDATVPEDTIYLITAIAGEIGNNSFDHNLGNWPSIAGVFFGYDIASINRFVILADRGLGILTTLRKVRPILQNDAQALEVAFKEKLSGRAPENRGNGLKFVRQTVKDQHLHLTFYSGQAQADLNEIMKITNQTNDVHGCLAIITF